MHIFKPDNTFTTKAYARIKQVHVNMFNNIYNHFKFVLPAAEPCLSPLESFLNAYDIVIGLLHRYWPFMASIAASDDSKLAKLMKA